MLIIRNTRPILLLLVHTRQSRIKIFLYSFIQALNFHSRVTVLAMSFSDGRIRWSREVKNHYSNSCYTLYVTPGDVTHLQVKTQTVNKLKVVSHSFLLQ